MLRALFISKIITCGIKNYARQHLRINLEESLIFCHFKIKFFPDISLVVLIIGVSGHVPRSRRTIYARFNLANAQLYKRRTLT